MLTRMQKKVLLELNKCIENNGVAPTVRELCDIIGIKSVSTMHTHLSKLERDGYIEKVPYSPRNIKVLKVDDSIFEERNNNMIICSGETVLYDSNKTKSYLTYRLYKKDFNMIKNELIECINIRGKEISSDELDIDIYECAYIDIIYNQITGITILEFKIFDFGEYASRDIILTEWTRSDFFKNIGKIMGQSL